MDPRMQDLAARGGQLPSRATQSGRESFPASDIEMVSLISAHEDHITECVLTLCEREHVVKTENGDISSTPVSTDYGRQFRSESDSCWRPNDSANEIVLTSHDGGHTRVNGTERAFCPISPYYHYFSPFAGTRAANNTQAWNYNLTRSSEDSDNAPPRPAAEFVGELNRTLETLATLLTTFGQNVSNHNAIGKAFLPVVTVHVRWQ